MPAASLGFRRVVLSLRRLRAAAGAGKDTAGWIAERGDQPSRRFDPKLRPSRSAPLRGPRRLTDGRRAFGIHSDRYGLPGGVFPFLRMPAGELRDLHMPLDTLWKADGFPLRARLLEAATPDAKFRVMERCLPTQAGRQLERNPMVEYTPNEMQGVPHARTISDVTGLPG